MLHRTLQIRDGAMATCLDCDKRITIYMSSTAAMNIYRKISNIRRNQNQNLNDSRFIMQLPFPNALKSGVKSRMRM